MKPFTTFRSRVESEDVCYFRLGQFFKFMPFVPYQMIIEQMNFYKEKSDLSLTAKKITFLFCTFIPFVA